MSVNTLHTNVEIEYINSMLEADEITIYEKAGCDYGVDVYQIFSVSGFNVAVLMSDITSIHKADSCEVDDCELLQGEGKFNIVNVSDLINPSYEVPHAEHYIILKDKKMALACDEILEKEKIDTDSVCWRDENSERKWLAGTVKNINIILLDIASIQNAQMTKNN